MRFDALYRKEQPLWKEKCEAKFEEILKDSGLSPQEMQRVLEVLQKYGMLRN